MRTSSLSPIGTAVAFLYPASWFATAAFGVMCLVLHTAAPRKPPTSLLVLAAFAQAIANLFYGVSVMDAGYRVGMPSDALWFASFILVLWAAWEHRPNVARQAAEFPRAETRWRAEAFVPAVVIGLAASAWFITEYENKGLLIVAPGLTTLALALLLGLREYLIIGNERHLRAAASASREDLASVLESTTDAVTVLDRDWKIVYRNRRANNLLGTPGFSPGCNL